MFRLIKRLIKILAIVVVVLIVGVLAIMLCEPLIYSDFFDRDSQIEFATPGKDDGLVQQGMVVINDELILSSGYMADKTPSRIYVTKGKKGERKTTYVQLKEVDGKHTKNHAGGIAVFDDYLYLCDSEGDPSQILVYNLDDVTNAKEGDDVTAIYAFDVHNNASFCTIKNNMLYVGEFYLEGKYKTDASHEMTTPSGKKHNALVHVYPLSSLMPYGVLSTSPVAAYSIDGIVQGMDIDDEGKIYLSQSSALLTSKIKIYNKQPTTPETHVEVDGKQIPLWYLEESELADEIDAPPMIEQISIHDGRLYAIFESASNKYIFGKLLAAKDVWSIEI